MTTLTNKNHQVKEKSNSQPNNVPLVRQTAASAARATFNANARSLFPPDKTPSPGRTARTPIPKLHLKEEHKIDDITNQVEPVMEKVHQKPISPKSPKSPRARSRTPKLGQPHIDTPIPVTIQATEDISQTVPDSPKETIEEVEPRITVPDSPKETIEEVEPRIKTPRDLSVDRRVEIVEPSNSADVLGKYKKLKSEFIKLKQDLDYRQNEIVMVLSRLRELSDNEGLQISAEDEIHNRDLKLINVKDWPADQLVELCRETSYEIKEHDKIKSIQTYNLETFSDINSEIKKVPIYLSKLCIEAFNSRQELLTILKKIIEEKQDEDMVKMLAEYNNQSLVMCKSLDSTKRRAEVEIENAVQLWEKICQEWNTLVEASQRLVREIESLKSELQEMEGKTQSNDMNQALMEKCQELELEKEKFIQFKKKSENELSLARNKLLRTEKHLRETDTEVTESRKTIDNLKKREKEIEEKHAKLREYYKTAQNSGNLTAKQKEDLKKENEELNAKINALNEKHKVDIRQLHEKIKILNSKIEQEKNEVQSLNKKKQFLEDEVLELQKKVNEQKNLDPEMLKREVHLAADLNATNICLIELQNTIDAIQKEKKDFLDGIKKTLVTEPNNKMEICNKLASEVLNKDEMVVKLQIELRKMNKEKVFQEKKAFEYEQYIDNYLSNHKSSAESEDGKEDNLVLDKTIMDLKIKLSEAENQNESLAEELLKMNHQLDQQEKASLQQAKLIKTREGYIHALENKEKEQTLQLANLQNDFEQRIKMVDKVNNQMAAKADEIHEMCALLETKQNQIFRLEKIVEALEEQQGRSQEQRTRQEEKIAMLERELVETNSKCSNFRLF